MEGSFRLCIVTGDETVLDTEVSYVNLPTGFGSVGILLNHAPMLCAVAEGVLRCRLKDGSTLRVRVSEGVASVADNELTVLCRSGAAPETASSPAGASDGTE